MPAQLSLATPALSVMIRPLGQSSFLEGSSIDLICRAIFGDLPLSIRWIQPNGVVYYGRQRTVNLVSDENFGTYICVGENSFGRNTSATLVEKAG